MVITHTGSLKDYKDSKGIYHKLLNEFWQVLGKHFAKCTALQLIFSAQRNRIYILLTPKCHHHHHLNIS